MRALFYGRHENYSPPTSQVKNEPVADNISKYHREPIVAGGDTFPKNWSF